MKRLGDAEAFRFAPCEVVTHGAFRAGNDAATALFLDRHFAQRPRRNGRARRSSALAAEGLVDQLGNAEEPSIYRRELPGGGFVSIVIARERETIRTRVSVERRAVDARRRGHTPVVIAEADGDERSPTFIDLFRIAADNAAIARALLRLQGRAD